jgi:hypothetical protein
VRGDEVGETGDEKCWKPEAIRALQEAAEAFLVREFESRSLENSKCVFIQTRLSTSNAAADYPCEVRHHHV